MTPVELRIVVRSALTAPGVSAVVLVVVAVLAFAAAAAPALLAHARTETVRAAVELIDPLARDLTGTLRGAAVPGDGDGGYGDPSVDAVWGAAATRLDAIRTGLPADIRRATGAPRITVTLDPQASAPLDGSPRRYNRMTVLFDPAFASRTRIVEGGSPVGASGTGTLAAALSTAASAELQWPVGESRSLPYAAGVLTVTVTGLFEPVDPDDGDWAHLPTALVPSIALQGAGDLVVQSALLADPARLGIAATYLNEVSTTAWLPVDAAGIDGADAVRLAAEMRGLAGEQLEFPIDDGGRYTAALLLDSSTPLSLDDGTARSDVMTAVLAAIAGGPVVVAAATLALTLRMLALRRVAAVRLAQARGASRGLVAVVLGAEGLALGIVGAVVGATLAAAVVGADAVGVALAGVVGALPGAVLPAVGLSSATTSARDDLGTAPPARARVRLVTDVAVAAAAVALVALTLARGRQAGADPVLVLLPVAVVAIGCVLALRLVPAVVGRLEAVGARRAGLVALLGPARARRESAARAAPVLAVVTGVAIALFSSSFAATVRSAAELAAARDVGADLRIAAPAIDSVQRDALTALPGVRAVALLLDQQRVEARAGDRRVPAVVYVVDATAFADVQSGEGPTPAWALPAPAGLVDTGGETVPVVASAGFASDAGDMPTAIDDVPLDVLATTPSANPFGDARSWLLVDEANSARLLSTVSSPRLAFLALTPDADPTAVATAAADLMGQGASTLTPAQAADRLTGDPSARAIADGLAASVAVVAALLGLAVTVTLVLGGASRRRLTALLTALGLRRRRELPLVAWEVGPALLLALVVGTAAGLGLPFLVIPALDLTLFVGGATPPVVVVDPAATAAVVGGALGVIAIAVAVASVVASRARRRIGDAGEGR